MAANPRVSIFKHPGVMHTRADIATMRRLITNHKQPAYGSFVLLRDHFCSKNNYVLNGPFRVISRDGEYRRTKTLMERDFSAAYQNTLMWVLTDDEAHAIKALNILLSYADTLTTISDTNDAPLLVGLEGWKIVYAAEMLRYTYSKMSTSQFNHISAMLHNVFQPVMERFYGQPPYTNGNWGAIVTKAYMALAVFFDNRLMYDKAVNFYLHACDNGTIEHYIDGITGQIQESGRDQGHCELGIGAMATVCEMAWKQGDDLYAALGNRLLKGYEYVSKYNLGNDVPFKQWTDITGKYCDWTVISEKSRGRYMPVFEIVYNHYVRRRGLQMPFTLQVLSQIRPEGYDRDQPAFGSLLFNP